MQGPPFHPYSPRSTSGTLTTSRLSRNSSQIQSGLLSLPWSFRNFTILARSTESQASNTRRLRRYCVVCWRVLVQDDRATFAILTYATSSSASLLKRDAPQESQVPFPLPGPQQPIGAISTCFTSLDSCNNSTSSCSGRGQCSQASKAGRTCFVCTCGATTIGEGNKVKTTYWAGESCERKDISRYVIVLIITKESTQYLSCVAHSF